jgi:hypothetical protein
MVAMRRARWQGIGASVRGTAHVRVGLPNQDAIGWTPACRNGLPLVLAVADGHGSARCFRSDAGAALAVSCGKSVLHEFLTAHPMEMAPASLARAAEESLPKQLEQSWKEAVTAALAQGPLSTAALDRLEAEHGAAARATIEANPLIAYGTTLLLAAVAENFCVYAQLGDGDIVTLSDKGETRRPLPPDPRLIANETTSLCMEEAWREVRVGIEAGNCASPALILVSTDGYANSYQNDEGFLKVAPDLLGLLRTHGLAAVGEHLGDWLDETSRDGSGDDITLGVICRLDAIEPQPKTDATEPAEALG